MFIIQGILFLIAGLCKSAISFEFKLDVYSITSVIFILNAMIIYPILGYFLGHVYPRSPLFGVAPCPTTIFTFCILLLTQRKTPKFILFIPLTWSIIGFSAAISLGFREDIGLLIAGLLGAFMILLK